MPLSLVGYYYCNVLFTGLPKKYIKKLELIQNTLPLHLPVKAVSMTVLISAFASIFSHNVYFVLVLHFKCKALYAFFSAVAAECIPTVLFYFKFVQMCPSFLSYSSTFWSACIHFLFCFFYVYFCFWHLFLLLSQTGDLKQRNRMQTHKACFTDINQSATMGKQGRAHRTGEQHFLLITNNYTQIQRKKPKAYIGAQ